MPLAFCAKAGLVKGVRCAYLWPTKRTFCLYLNVPCCFFILIDVASIPMFLINVAIPVPPSAQLHLTPLHAVVQMRPDLAHIDAADAQRKLAEAEAAGANAREAQAQQPADQQQAVKAISVQYRKVDSERVQDIKRSSFAYLQDKLEREKWVDLDIKSRHVRPSVFARLFLLESVLDLQCHSISIIHLLFVFGSALSILFFFFFAVSLCVSPRACAAGRDAGRV